MSKEIKIEFLWDRETYLKASEIVYNYELKKSPKRFLGWIFIAMSQFGVVMAMKKGAAGLLSISTILIIYWYGFRWNIRRYFINKSFDKLPNANRNIHILLKDDGLYLDHAKISWEEIAGVILLQDGFIVYLTNSSFFIPSFAFNNADERNEFAKIVEQKIKYFSNQIK